MRTDCPIALAIDHGEARIGLAASDACGLFAHPVATINARAKDALEQIVALIHQRGASVVVLGLPLRSDGSEGPASERVRAFAQALKELLPEMRYEFEDESFSTVTAAKKLRTMGKSSRRNKQVLDQAAAVEILQSWLERQHFSAEEDPAN